MPSTRTTTPILTALLGTFAYLFIAHENYICDFYTAQFLAERARHRAANDALRRECRLHGLANRQLREDLRAAEARIEEL